MCLVLSKGSLYLCTVESKQIRIIEIMMEERYSRNRIYLTEEEQEKIKSVRILLGGAGIGSIIAECALRFGFESITIVDGDKVELSNLNRQNYTKADVKKYKAECLSKRLLRINPQADIRFHNTFITHDNVHDLIEGHHIAVNALDFKSDIPFVFDQICKEQKIPVLHPYNFGWAGFLTIVKPDGYPLTELNPDYKNFEYEMAQYVSRFGHFWNMPTCWLDNVLTTYKKEGLSAPPPQLSIGSWIAAGFCVNAIFNIVTGRDVKYFPKFYFSSILNENENNNGYVK